MSEQSKSQLFLEYECKLDQVVAAIRIDPENEGNLTALLVLLEYYVRRAIHDDFDLEMEVYREARYWLAEERCRNQVWQWTLKMAREAKGEQQGRMCVTIFEYFTLPNVGIEFLIMLFDTWCDHKLRWILPEIYRHKPRRLYGDLVAVSTVTAEAEKGR
jgi:hypothetical protein